METCSVLLEKKDFKNEATWNELANRVIKKYEMNRFITPNNIEFVEVKVIDYNLITK